MNGGCDDKISGEFDCSECGRHIIQICGPVNLFHLCAACMTIPGWYKIPELRERLDPEMEAPNE